MAISIRAFLSISLMLGCLLDGRHFPGIQKDEKKGSA
jgi:hypothetical protein